jgi:hypothetical protein
MDEKVTENSFRNNLGFAADIIAIVTFVYSILDVNLPEIKVVLLELGEPLTHSRLLMSIIIIIATAYTATTRHLKRMFNGGLDKNLLISVIVIIVSMTAWIFVYSLRNILFCVQIIEHQLLFTLFYIIWVLLYYIFLINNFEKEDELRSLIVGSLIIFALFYGISAYHFSWFYTISVSIIVFSIIRLVAVYPSNQ